MKNQCKTVSGCLPGAVGIVGDYIFFFELFYIFKISYSEQL